jgi:hypothetical protein
MADKLKVSEVKILKHLAKYDPELAEELATSNEPIEEKIASEIMFARMVKYQKVRELDLETLLVTFDFWNEMMKRAIQYITACNTFFMMNFMEQYSYIAQAVQERIKSETPDPRAVLVMKGLELMDELKEQMKGLQGMNQPYLSFYSKEEKGGEEGGEKKKTRKRRRRKRKVKVVLPAKA